MLKDVELNRKMEKSQWEAGAEDLTAKLGMLQQKARQLKIPVIVVFEGWGASGKGSLISRVIGSLDPRGFSVYSILPPTSDEKRYPWMRRYWQKIPVYGEFSIFDRSWYQETVVYEKGLSDEQRELKWAEIEDFERQLTEDGYILLKFFLHISKKEQKQRFESLKGKKETCWRVTKDDWKHHEQYGAYRKKFDDMLERTDFMNAPWIVTEATDKYYAAYKTITTLIEALEKAIDEKEKMNDIAFQGIRTSTDILSLPIPLLADIQALQPIEDKVYRKELKDSQKRLFELHNRLYQKKIPLILAYEGWDAAGKGGNIKRVTRSLDPRGYEVIPICAPTPLEKNHQHLWRFWNALPRDGHIAIFDRTWYGRCMVEQIEGFCTAEQWGRSYDEINRFERQLANWGAVILKFWLHIDKDEQLKRFQARENTPEKKYKITDEDWRNREKWNVYEDAVNEMLARTNTEWAPWIIVESDYKKYARIKVLQEIITTLESRL